MATIAEQLTTLNTNLSTISTEVGSQADLIAQIKATAESLPDAGSGSSGYQLWGSHSVKPDSIEVAHLAGTYSVSGIYTWFYDYNYGNGWMCMEVTEIIVYEDGTIEVNHTRDDFDTYLKIYDIQADVWFDESDGNVNDPHLLIYDIPTPIAVSENIYHLFVEMYDNGEYTQSYFDHAYDIGGAAQSGDLEALGVLCDWQITTDSDSCPLLTIINHHPSYYLHCTVCDEYGADWWDYDTDDYFGWEVYVTVPPDSTKTIYADTPFSEIKPVYIDNVRWSANA